MATIKQKIDAERKMRDLCEDSGLPQPDWVEYGYTCIRLFWEAAKAVIVVDIDEREEPDEISFAALEEDGFGKISLAAVEADAFSDLGGDVDETLELARRPEQRGEDDADDRDNQPDDPALGLAGDHDRSDRDPDPDHAAGGDQPDDKALEPGPPDLSRGEHVR